MRAWEFLERGPEHPQVWHNIACIYGLLAKASKDSSQDSYNELVFDFLGRAVKTGGKTELATIQRDRGYFPAKIFQSEDWKRIKQLALP